MASTQSTPRPFLKWAGGKRQLLPKLLEAMPESFGDYHEPFLGGGALFFGLSSAERLDGRRVYLADSNAELVQTYKAIRDDVEAVINSLGHLEYDEALFYKVRAIDPAGLDATAVAARMIYLNRTCFNGLYRVNKKGKFNVSWGRYTDPVICDAENLRAVSCALDGVSLECQRFETPFDGMYDPAKLRDRVKPQSFVYLDPPYMPVSTTANFTGFTRDGWGHEQNAELLGMFAAYVNGGAFVLLSSSDDKWARNRYRNWSITALQARRSINSNATKRGPVLELLIASYEKGGQLGLEI